ncbi:MAG: hypothetical protein ACFB4I_03665 [Cyanophyceae cyanobacterium]
MIANPLRYPIAVLAGGIVLFVGVRLLQLPSAAMLPASAAIACLGSAFLKSREPERINLGNPALEQELQSVQQQAHRLAQQAESLRAEAEKLLTSSTQIDLLVAVQYACDRAIELPQKLARLVRRLHGADSLLSPQDLQQQLQEVQEKQRHSSGVARQQLDRLAESLRRNLTLARQGQDARQAQVISLSTLITDSAGVLQQLQNRLRTSDLQDSEQIQELRSLSEELSGFQENVDVLVR